MIVEFKPSKLDGDLCTMFNKFDTAIAASIERDIKNGFVTPLKIYADQQLMGALIVKGEINHKGELIFVVLHVMGYDNAQYPFNLFMSDHLWLYVKTLKNKFANGIEQPFRYIRLHADRPGLIRMAEKIYSKPSEIVFLKDLYEV
jgi:hypothetical protein